MQVELSHLKPKGVIAIACSGGADSLALTILLAEKHNVIALIVNHNLRSASKTEAERTSAILNKLGIKNKILTYKGKTPTRNLMQEARKIRYKLLLEYCKKNNINTLATAHHANDNAENFLLRLARGSGVDGLSSMPTTTEMEGVKVIRPLLPFTKAEIISYLKSKKIKWVEDATNKTDKYKRNSLRHALDKLEDKELITKRINDASLNLLRVRDYLEQQTALAAKAVVKNNEIDLKKFAKLHDEIAFRLLSLVIANFSPKPQKPRFSELKGLKTALLDGKKRTLAGLIFAPLKNKVIVTLE